MPFKRHRHYGTNVVIAYLIAAIILTPFPIPEPFDIIVMATLAVILVIGQIAALRHTFGHLCEECIASMPLNPQEKTDHSKPLLRGFHQLFGTPARSKLTAVVQMTLAIGTLALAIFVGGPAYTVTMEATLLLLLLASVTGGAHRKYQPWCPYCRRGGGGYARADAPDPTIPQPI